MKESGSTLGNPQKRLEDSQDERVFLQGVNVPESVSRGTREAIATESANRLIEHVEYLPREELYNVAYQLAIKVIQTELRQGDIDEWRESHAGEAVMADAVLDSALRQKKQVAIPRSINPAQYIKEFKKDSRFKKFFNSKGKQDTLELELHKLVVDAIERVEALNLKAKEIEEEANKKAERIISEADEKLREAKQEATQIKAEANKKSNATEEKAKLIVNEAKAEEQTIKLRIETLEQRLAFLRAEALEDPGLARALKKMEDEEEKGIKKQLVEKAKAFSERIKNLHINALVDDTNDAKVRNSIEIKLILQQFLKTANALKEIEKRYGILYRKQIAHEIYEDIDTDVRLGITTTFHSGLYAIYDTKNLKPLAQLLETCTNFDRIIRNVNTVIDKMMGVNRGTVDTVTTLDNLHLGHKGE